MDARTLPIFFLFVTSVVIGAWQTADDYPDRGLRRSMHSHSKRHMLLRENERKRRITTQKPREHKNKPSGNLKPIREDEMEDNEVVSVAVGPPQRPKYDKTYRTLPKRIDRTNSNGNNTVASLVKDVLAQLGREFLTREINEDFIFGQYVGVAIKNLTQDIKLKVQHEIIDVILKYQKNYHGESLSSVSKVNEENTQLSQVKDIKFDRKSANDTEEGWPDFKNLAKIVG